MQSHQLHVEILYLYALKLARKKRLGFLSEKLHDPAYAMAAKTHQHRHKGGFVTIHLSSEGSATTSSSRSSGLDWLHLTMKLPFNGSERVILFSFPFIPLLRSLVHVIT